MYVILNIKPRQEFEATGFTRLFKYDPKDLVLKLTGERGRSYKGTKQYWREDGQKEGRYRVWKNRMEASS